MTTNCLFSESSGVPGEYSPTGERNGVGWECTEGPETATGNDTLGSNCLRLPANRQEHLSTYRQLSPNATSRRCGVVERTPTSRVLIERTDLQVSAGPSLQKPVLIKGQFSGFVLLVR